MNKKQPKPFFVSQNLDYDDAIFNEAFDNYFHENKILSKTILVYFFLKESGNSLK